MAGKIESFRDLNVYKTAVELQQEIFVLTKKFPKEEIYSLTDQIKRSSRLRQWHRILAEVCVIRRRFFRMMLSLPPFHSRQKNSR